jgi:hypothetical protein
MGNDKFFHPLHSNLRTTQVGDDEVVASGSVDFGIKDDKGRAIGTSWTVCRVEYRDLTADELAAYFGGRRSASLVIAGTHYTAKTYATRAGQGFGAYHYPTYYATREAAEKAATKKVEASRKRYAKQFAGVK